MKPTSRASTLRRALSVKPRTVALALIIIAAIALVVASAFGAAVTM